MARCDFEGVGKAFVRGDPLGSAAISMVGRLTSRGKEAYGSLVVQDTDADLLGQTIRIVPDDGDSFDVVAGGRSGEAWAVASHGHMPWWP